jgi:hypothetical protein
LPLLIVQSKRRYLAIVSCVLCLVFTGCWIRSYYSFAQIIALGNHYFRLCSTGGQVRFTYSTHGPDLGGYQIVADSQAQAKYSTFSGKRNPFSQWKRWGFDVAYTPAARGLLDTYGGVPTNFNDIAIPYWFITSLVTLPLPLLMIFKWRTRRVRLRRGQCVRCGYDLRASNGRCPECGTMETTSSEKSLEVNL